MKDFLGRKVNIGDYIVCSGFPVFEIYKVAGFTKKGVIRVNKKVDINTFDKSKDRYKVIYENEFIKI